MKNEIEQSKGKDIDLSRQKNEPEQAVTVEGESTAKETAASVLDPIERLAYDIDQFVFDFDPYEYRATGRLKLKAWQHLYVEDTRAAFGIGSRVS